MANCRVKLLNDVVLQLGLRVNRTTPVGLIDASADVNYNGGEALLKTIRHEELLVAFFQGKPSVSVLNLALCLALKLGGRENVSRAIALLLDAGADMNFEDGKAIL